MRAKLTHEQALEMPHHVVPLAMTVAVAIEHEL